MPHWSVTAARMLGRSLTLRCPRCGAGGVLRTWFRFRDGCPRCGQPLERKSHDYYLGGIMFNLIVAELLWAAGFLAWLLLSWPDPPWDLLQTVGVAFMIVLPVATYPITKLIWLSWDLFFRPEADEETEGERTAEGRLRR